MDDTLCVGWRSCRGCAISLLGRRGVTLWFAIFTSTDSFQHDVLVTGGEDSTIITWRIQDPSLGDSLTPDQLADPMKSDMPNLKREWNDTMDVNQASPVSNLPCDVFFFFPSTSLPGWQTGEVVANVTRSGLYHCKL